MVFGLAYSAVLPFILRSVLLVEASCSVDDPRRLYTPYMAEYMAQPVGFVMAKCNLCEKEFDTLPISGRCDECRSKMALLSDWFDRTSTRESPPETTGLSPEGLGTQPAQPRPPEVFEQGQALPRAGAMPPLPLPEVTPRGSVRAAMEDEEPKRRKIMLSGWRPYIFPGANPTFRRDEFVKGDTGTQRMEAARRIACILAMHKCPGFTEVLMYLDRRQPINVYNWRKIHSIVTCNQHRTRDEVLDGAYQVRDAFIIMANTDIIPETAIRTASHCGGLTPGGDGYAPLPCPDWPQWGDVSIRVYDILMQNVLSVTKHNRPCIRRQVGLDRLYTLNAEQCTDVVRAYLAAADASARLIEHDESAGTVPWHRPYEEMKGGTFNYNDEVAQYINAWIKAYYEMYPLAEYYEE